MLNNLSNLDFLNALDEKLKNLWMSYLNKYHSASNQIGSPNTSDEILGKLIKIRSSSEKGYCRVKEAYRQNRTLIAIRNYQDSDFGVVMYQNGRQYHKVFKTTDRASVNSWIFDFVKTNDSLSNAFKPVTAREYISYINSNYNVDNLSAFHRRMYNKAQSAMLEELKAHQQPFGWVKQFGLSAYGKRMTWLNIPKSELPKIDAVLTIKQGRPAFNRDVGKWNGVTFARNSEFSDHFAPKNWIMGESGLVYPLSYARRKNFKIRTSIPNSAVMSLNSKYSESTISFSHRLGYYDNSEYVAYRGKLYKLDEVVTLHNGKPVPKEQAKFVERHNAYYLKDQVVTCQDGSLELRSECMSYSGSWYHNSTTEFRQCGLCGNTHPTASFRLLIENDADSGEACGDCYSSARREIRRMCYSTDVIDHKGFGSTNMKINGEGVYLGLELETYADYNDENREEISAKLNSFAAHKENKYTVATRDGSLCGSHGIEYIFRPEGLLHQKRNVNHFINKMNGLLVEDAGDGYGLHIHVSDHFLTNVDKVRIDNFISMYEKYFRVIGARGDTEYQHAKKISSNKTLKQQVDSKYKMVNIGRSGTIEYRFPKSLVNEVHISMNLEMALAVTMYCKYQLSSAKLDTRSENPAALRGFIEYVEANKKTYPLLHAENGVKIKLDKLETYSEFCKQALKAKKVQESHDDSYTLAA